MVAVIPRCGLREAKSGVLCSGVYMAVFHLLARVRLHLAEHMNVRIMQVALL